MILPSCEERMKTVPQSAVLTFWPSCGCAGELDSSSYSQPVFCPIILLSRCNLSLIYSPVAGLSVSLLTSFSAEFLPRSALLAAPDPLAGHPLHICSLRSALLHAALLWARPMRVFLCAQSPFSLRSFQYLGHYLRKGQFEHCLISLPSSLVTAGF